MTATGCRMCGNPVPRTRAKFCGKTCMTAFNEVPVKTCAECSGPIPRRAPSQMVKAKFCGNPCKFAYLARNPNRARVERTLAPCGNPACGKTVAYLPSQRWAGRPGESSAIYCSRKCFGVGHSLTMKGRRPSGGVYASVDTFRFMVRLQLLNRCAICGWAEASCDAAHIVARKSGGEDVIENIVMLCPNHHRMYDTGKITEAAIRAARENCVPEGGCLTASVAVRL